MQDLTVTIPAETLRNRDLLDIVIQKTVDEVLKSSESGSACRLSVSRQHEIYNHAPNAPKPESISIGQPSLQSIVQDCLELDHAGQAGNELQGGGVVHSLTSFGLLGMASLVMAFLSLQVMRSLPDTGPVVDGAMVSVQNTRDDIMEVAIAMTTVVMTLNLYCLLITMMQAFFLAKILQLAHGQLRAAKYLKECASTRFIAVMGFFVSIPAFFVGLILWIILHFQSTPAIIAIVVLSVGIISCLVGLIQNGYHWRLEKLRADNGLPVYDMSPLEKDFRDKRKHLSTLV